MYLLPKQAMELLQITTRQGLHKIVVNHNITVKSQGAGKPNLYLKEDLERYKKDNAKNIKAMKNPQVIEKAKKNKKDKVQRINKNKSLKKEVKKDLQLDEEKSNENWSVYTGKDNVDKVIEDLTNKQVNKKDKVHSSYIGPIENGPIIDGPNEKDLQNIKEEKENQIKKDLQLPNDDEIENPLNKVGMAEYERVTELLKEQGTYKDVDRALVLAYAISYQKYIFSTIASGKQDDTTMDDFGNLKLHPYFLVAKESFNQMEKTAKLLGIGSRSRVGLEISKPKKESIFDILNSKEKFE